MKYCGKKHGQFFSGEMSGGRLWLDSEDSTESPKTEKGKYEALFVKWGTDRIETVIFDKGNIEDKESDRYNQYLFTRQHLPSAYAMFTHTACVFGKDRLDQDYSTDKRRKFWNACIKVVTQQLPTGQVQEVSLPFRAGNKNRFFMLVELPDAKLDYGRKGFRADINSYVQFLASELILDYFLARRVLLRPTSIAHGGTALLKYIIPYVQSQHGCKFKSDALEQVQQDNK